MPETLLLQHDWKDYDNRKIRERHSPMIFCCKQQWEARYLASKIRQLYPDINEKDIHSEIQECCREKSEPVDRKEFVKRVMIKLMKI